MPDTMLVASPPRRSKISMAAMSARKARGVAMARIRAGRDGVFGPCPVAWSEEAALEPGPSAELPSEEAVLGLESSVEFS